MLFRVWCKDYKEWEKDDCFLNTNGELVMFKSPIGFIKPKPENHIVEMNTGFVDINNQEIFVGDVVRYEDGNCGYGRLRDYYLDGYIYLVVTNNYKDKEEFDDCWIILEKVGDIHHPLPEEMQTSFKYWTDEEFRKEFQKKNGKEKYSW